MTHVRVCVFSSFQIHGRSQQQRYTKEADWNYLSACVQSSQRVLYNDDMNEAPVVPVSGRVVTCVQLW